MQIYDVIIIGSGAAGYACAVRLHSFGVTDIAVLTEGRTSGTSRNTGSDKQTYYKLDLCSDGGDSVRKMALDLFSGGSMNGSDAFIQAACSARSFMFLAELGVPFPKDEFGRFPGYKTDHDNTMRATSAGPLTSKFMTELLEKKVIENGTEILDGHQVIKLITDGNRCCGALCLTPDGIKKIYAKCVILCTGAPAEMYSRSVYPQSQRGATGLAIEAGCELANFQEWQYGIASVGFRWNLSGSYQQVIPRYFSVDADGNENEFLYNEYSSDIYSKIFLKGYQWPFDARKTDGSSRVDMLVFAELEKGRRVFLDYTKNPMGYNFDDLSDEAREYLIRTDSVAGTPVERLGKLNPKALELYKNHGIDLRRDMLEISLCAQHQNGGIRTDKHFETTVPGLFAVGEAGGKFGVYRPGGCALNDTQVGALCAAEYISKILPGVGVPAFSGCEAGPAAVSAEPTIHKIKAEITEEMSNCCGNIRDYNRIKSFISRLTELDERFYDLVTIGKDDGPGDFYSLRLTVKAMRSMCVTALRSIEKIGSRGGCICIKDGKILPENEDFRRFITVTRGDEVTFSEVDSVPDETPVFEKLLRQTQV